MNTLSMAICLIGVFGFRPMYCSARSMPSRLTGSACLAGSGTTASIATTISGDVPQVTCGWISAASSSTTRSNCAPASRTQRAPVGHRLVPDLALGREGAALEIIDRGVVHRNDAHARTAFDRHVAQGHAPFHATARESRCRRIRWHSRCRRPCRCVPMMASAMSLAVTPLPSLPSTATSMVFDFFCSRHCVASTCSTSEVPMPCASAGEGAVRRGMRIAADDRHPRQRRAVFRADDMDDALASDP